MQTLSIVIRASTHRQQPIIDDAPTQNGDNFEKIDAKVQYFLLLNNKICSASGGSAPRTLVIFV